MKHPTLPRAAQKTRLSVLASLLLLLAGCGQSTGNRAGYATRTPDVGVMTIDYREATLTTDLPGRISPYEQADVRPQVNGILKARLFEEGGTVRTGQALYQIDPAPYQAVFDSGKAALANAQASLATMRAKADRYASLLKQNAIAPQDYDDAVAAYKQAEANVLQQMANLESARINLGYTRIIAPITGRIGRSLVTVGALVTADQTNPLATIQTLDPIYVDINQSTADLLVLKKALAAGQLSGGIPGTARVTLMLDDGSTYPLDGKLQFAEATVDANTGEVVLRAIFSNPNGILLPGMYARATLVEGIEKHAILAPQQAVGRDDKGEPTAFVVDDRGIARQRVLQAARAVGQFWLVTAGLAPGDRLIVDGLQSVRDGQPVHAVLWSARASSAAHGS